jgi:hypothetical protein
MKAGLYHSCVQITLNINTRCLNVSQYVVKGQEILLQVNDFLKIYECIRYVVSVTFVCSFYLFFSVS